jgi:hypothetical protein
MKVLPLAGGVAALLFALLLASDARADDDVATSASSVLVGEPFTLTIRVEVAPGAGVDIEPGAPSWGDVSVLGVRRHEVTRGPEGDVHTFEVEAAAFAPGEAAFRPAVLVSGASGTEIRELPEVRLTVPSVLRPGDPLELRPLPEPAPIGGGVPLWIRPAAALGAGFAAFALSAVAWRAFSAARRRPPVPAPEAPAPLPSIEELAAAVEADPAVGYRRVASAIRAALAERYRIPAASLTAGELRRRLEERGERWVARLVAGLLEECDAVVYGGYRPAPERRRADLAMAAELLQGAE